MQHIGMHVCVICVSTCRNMCARLHTSNNIHFCFINNFHAWINTVKKSVVDHISLLLFFFAAYRGHHQITWSWMWTKDWGITWSRS